MNDDNQKTREENVKEFLDKRSVFISIKAKVGKLIEPKLFQLQLENLSNVRNTIIIAGTLAAIGLFVFQTDTSNFPNVTIALLNTSTIGFLATILFYSFFLKQSLGKGIKLYREKMKESVDTAEKGEEVINDYFDNKINKKGADKKLQEIYKEIEFERIRVRPDEQKKQEFIEQYLALSGNTTFTFSIILIVIAFVYMVV